MSALVLFLRAPVLGQAKTRLAREIGSVPALRVYKRLVAHALNGLRGLEHPLQCWYAGDVSVLTACWPELRTMRLRPQWGADLGERMANAIAGAPVEAGEPVVLIGSDCPGIDAAYVREAFAALDAGADLILGPASDGGYGLIGMRECRYELFRGVPWSTDAVAAVTRRKAVALGLRVTSLAEIWDVDNAADWRRFCAAGR